MVSYSSDKNDYNWDMPTSILLNERSFYRWQLRLQMNEKQKQKIDRMLQPIKNAIKIIKSFAIKNAQVMKQFNFNVKLS